MRSALDEYTETIVWQRYGRVGGVIEVDEIRPKVLERKKVVGRNGKDLPQAKSKNISDFLLYPELSDGRIGLPVGRSRRVERSKLREQRLGRKLGAYGVTLEELEPKR